MSDVDNWPLPEFNPGPQKHLHAIGVISLNFNKLERSVEQLFFAKAEQTGIPERFAQKYFYRLDEEKKDAAIRDIYTEDLQEEPELIAQIVRLMECVAWARDCRNKILHSEMHPISFYHNQDLLYLTKRFSKNSARSGFIEFDLEQLRGIAINIMNYVIRSAEINLYMRHRNTPVEDLRPSYKRFKNLPKDLLKVESKIDLKEFPMKP